MKKDSQKVTGAAELRRKAEVLLIKRDLEDSNVIMEANNAKLIHELQVHQIELEMQNDELLNSRADLEAASARYTELYDFAPVGYFTLDLSRAITSTNLAGAHLFGVERSKLMGKRFGAFVAEVHLPAFNAFFKQIAKGESCSKCEVALEREDKLEISVQIDALVSEDGLEYRVVVVDISERKRAEQTLLAKNIELERFNYTVSHDLRSPLVTIKTFMGYLVQDMACEDKEKIVGDMHFINDAVDKMNSLLQELLDLTRIGYSPNIAIFTPLQDIVGEALGLVAGSIDKRSVRVQTTQEPLLLFGDRVRLVAVFQNLFDNAVKFMGEQTEPLIEIGFERKNGDVVVSVRDNGMGIDLRHQDRVFGIFEKLHANAKGLGMGLALVKRIIDLHGGRIWLESDGIGTGACFQFVLPEEGE